jgi:glycosyltransferase involved in cell wall biosynthesis
MIRKKSSGIKILHVASHLDVRMGGSILAAVQIADAVEGGEITCTVAGTAVSGSNTEKYFQENFPRLRFEAFPMEFPRRSFHSRQLRNWLRSQVGHFDIVHTHGLFNFPYLFGGWAAIQSGRPLVISPHNSLDPYDLRKRAWLKRWIYGPWVVRQLLARCERVLCSAPLESERLVTYGASPAPQVETIPYPVPPLPEGRGTGDWRSKHGISPKACAILFLSRLDRKKGLDLLVPAFLQLAAEQPDVVLVIAGSGEETLAAEMRSQIAVAGLERRVFWTGFITGADRLQAYRECDVFALPSYNENFGLVVVEAMYAGKPVLISREVYIHETIDRHRCAEVCETTTESVLAGLRRLTRDSARREKMGQLARSAALTEFAPDRVRGRLLQMYRALTRDSPSDFLQHSAS